MKKYLQIIVLTVLIFSSFGFKSCDSAYCYIITYLTGITFGNWVISENGILKLSVTDCTDELVHENKVSLNSISSTSPFSRMSGEKIICAVGDSGSVVWSSDSGKTWEDHSIHALTKNLYGFDFLHYGADNIKVIVCGDSGTVYKSTDVGGNWAWQQINPPTSEKLNSIGALGHSVYILVGENGTIFRSLDGAQNWENRTIPDTSVDFNKVFIGSKVNAFGPAWAVGDNGKIYSTIDYGSSWTQRQSGTTNNFFDIIFRNPTDGIAVGENGTVRYTSDGGITWHEDPYFNGLTDGDIISITGQDSVTAIALIQGGSDNPGGTTLLTVSSEPLVDVKDVSQIPSEFLLNQNFPNPFNPATKIRYEIGSRQFVTLKIYDVLGNEVATLVDEFKPEGSYEVEFNSSSNNALSASGVYFYRLNAGSYTETKKFVLLK